MSTTSAQSLKHLFGSAATEDGMRKLLREFFCNPTADFDPATGRVFTSSRTIEDATVRRKGKRFHFGQIEPTPNA